MPKYFIQLTLLTDILLFVSTGILSAQTEAKTPIRGICIYIDYPDVPVSVSPAEWEGIFNDMDYQAPRRCRTN